MVFKFYCLGGSNRQDTSETMSSSKGTVSSASTRAGPTRDTELIFVSSEELAPVADGYKQKEWEAFQRWITGIEFLVCCFVCSSPGALVTVLRKVIPRGFSVVTASEEINGFTPVLLAVKSELKDKAATAASKFVISNAEKQKCAREEMKIMTRGAQFSTIVVSEQPGFFTWCLHNGKKSSGPKASIWVSRDGSCLEFYDSDGIKRTTSTGKVAVVQKQHFQALSEDGKKVMSAFSYIFRVLQSGDFDIAIAAKLINLIAPGWNYLSEAVAKTRGITSPFVHHQKTGTLANKLTSKGSEVSDVLVALGFAQKEELPEDATFRQIVDSFIAPPGGIVKQDLEELYESFESGIEVVEEQREKDRLERLRRISKSKEPVHKSNTFSALAEEEPTSDDSETEDLEEEGEGCSQQVAQEEAFPSISTKDYPSLGNTTEVKPPSSSVWGKRPCGGPGA